MCSSETACFQRTTRHYIPENKTTHERVSSETDDVDLQLEVKKKQGRIIKFE
jgi:hypothetical protein